jgi:hypothetical protein
VAIILDSYKLFVIPIAPDEGYLWNASCAQECDVYVCIIIIWW